MGDGGFMMLGAKKTNSSGVTAQGEKAARGA